jgi:hypothetical protein
MLLALSTECIPWINHVLCVGFRNGIGIYMILNLNKKVGEEIYYSKGFDKKEDLQALLFLCLGGSHVADIAYHVFRTPLVSTIHS